MASATPPDSPPLPTSRRRLWLAALLSFLVTGLGHVYSGRPRLGAALWVAGFGFGLVGALLLVALPSLALFVAIGLFGLAALAAVAIDAWRSARQADLDYRLHWFNRWYWYLAAFGLSGFVVQPRLTRFVKRRLIEAYRLPSDSMSPTYEDGDFLPASPLRAAPKRGEVVVYRAPVGARIKRVVGARGDTIGMRDAHLIVNGRVVPEPYETHDSTDPMADEFAWQRDFLAPGVSRRTYAPSRHTGGPLVVPRAEYFVLGDNRDNSLDSRYTGFVPRDSITQRPILVYFSWNRATHAVRWSHMGRVH